MNKQHLGGGMQVRFNQGVGGGYSRQGTVNFGSCMNETRRRRKAKPAGGGRRGKKR